MLQKYCKPEKIIWARANRKRPTPAEQALVAALRAASKGKYRWITQALIAGFIADVYCASVRVVVEVDGLSHNGRQKQDSSRDAIFRDRFKLITLRFQNEQVLSDPAGVAEKIIRFCDSCPRKARKK